MKHFLLILALICACSCTIDIGSFYDKTKDSNKTCFQIDKNCYICRYEFVDEFGHLWYYFYDLNSTKYRFAIYHSPECPICKKSFESEKSDHSSIFN